MILLDTHAWIWWLSAPNRVGPEARRAIEQAIDRGAALVSSVSVWEVALLVTRGRLQLDRPVRAWLAEAEAVAGFRFVPVDNRIATESVLLREGLHADPADRFIAATALVCSVPLATADEKLRAYPPLCTVW